MKKIEENVMYRHNHLIPAFSQRIGHKYLAFYPWSLLMYLRMHFLWAVWRRHGKFPTEAGFGIVLKQRQHYGTIISFGFYNPLRPYLF